MMLERASVLIYRELELAMVFFISFTSDYLSDTCAAKQLQASAQTEISNCTRESRENSRYIKNSIISGMIISVPKNLSYTDIFSVQ